MNCNYFGKCGSCTLHDKTYEVQLDYKYEREKKRFDKFLPKDLSIDIIKSETEQFRYRAEFRIWKTFLDKGTKESPLLSYAMSDMEKNTLEIDQCSIVSNDISNLMPLLINCLQEKEILSQKLFSCEFLNSTTGDMLVTLIYHKKLDDKWKKEASLLEKEFNISIIGRSRKQKEILSKDFIEEELSINQQSYIFQYKEGGFTQPNTKVNIQMIEWVLNNTEGKGNLCELYCGGGNFTIPLSKKFERVLATEISKTSIKSAKLNCELNDISNIEFIRMSSEEFV
ncbi:MAG: tRNA (uridine(54)-C5)-methyltransferase TrmA, partial [Campylobacteraceae bacterium]|nr:tRNA (uridine(54)-C5)-methyltransferase TrmA [Campylobacteraceae bacterium]